MEVYFAVLVTFPLFIAGGKIDLGKSCSLKNSVIECNGPGGVKSIAELVKTIRNNQSMENTHKIKTTTELRFTDYPSLIEVDFKIPGVYFLKNLVKLVLDNCGVQNVAHQAFSSLSNLEIIEIVGNKRLSNLLWSSFIGCEVCHSLLIDKSSLKCDCNALWMLNKTASDIPVEFIYQPRHLTYALSTWKYFKLPSEVTVTMFKINYQKISSEKCYKHIKHSCPIPNLYLNFASKSQETELNGNLLLNASLFTTSEIDAHNETIEIMYPDMPYKNVHQTTNQRIISLNNLTQPSSNWLFARISDARISPLPLVKGAPVIVRGLPLMRFGYSVIERMIFCHFNVHIYPSYTFLGFNSTLKDGSENILEENYEKLHFLNWETFQPKPSMFSLLRVQLNVPVFVFEHDVDTYKLTVCNSYGCASDHCNITAIKRDTNYSQIQTNQVNHLGYDYRPTTKVSHDSLSSTMVAVMIMGSFLTLLITLITVYCLLVMIQRKRKTQDRFETNELLGTHELVENIAYDTIAKYESLSQLQLESHVTIVHESSFKLVQEVGVGAFGQVFLVECQKKDNHSHNSNNNRPVRVDLHFVYPKAKNLLAAKRLCITTKRHVENLVQETANIARLNHKNIVKFEGISNEPKTTTVYLLFEYMQFGDLKIFLNTLHFGNSSGGLEKLVSYSAWKTAIGDFDHTIPNQISQEDMLNMASQIAEGLVYLSDNQIIHRDLAARNCLVGLNLTVKIADFGMSKDVYVENYYKTGGEKMLPVRWLPPEALFFGRYMPVTDIWSFGIVMWEIFTYGQQPWCYLSNMQVFEHIKMGKILECPNNCPKELYEVMKNCWTYEYSQRPDARTVLKQIQLYNKSTYHKGN